VLQHRMMPVMALTHARSDGGEQAPHRPTATSIRNRHPGEQKLLSSNAGVAGGGEPGECWWDTAPARRWPVLLESRASLGGHGRVRRPTATNWRASGPCGVRAGEPAGLCGVPAGQPLVLAEFVLASRPALRSTCWPTAGPCGVGAGELAVLAKFVLASRRSLRSSVTSWPGGPSA
jgi:hypothetical protein